MAGGERYFQRTVLIPESRRKNFDQALIRWDGVQVKPNSMEMLTEQQIGEVLDLIRANPTMDGVVMAIMGGKLSAREKQFSAMVAGDVAGVKEAIGQYYWWERTALIYSDLISGVIKWRNDAGPEDPHQAETSPVNLF